MPSKPTDRLTVAVKLSVAGRQLIEERAAAECPPRRDGQPNKSEMLRRMLAFAARNMPKGWTP